MLDVPNFFWESEPNLYPLYIAVREYLEIKPRIQVLNERCRVFLDLAEILSDSVADSRTSRTSLALNPHTSAHTNLYPTDQTWIIIVLIIISILVTISEVFLRFGLLHAREGAEAAPAAIIARAMGRSPRAAPSGLSYSTSNPPPGCICPSIPSADGSDMGMSGIMGLDV